METPKKRIPITGTHLVLVNALATYTRMLLCAVLALLSSRWILSALGQTDFGLYAVVAGIIGFLGFLTGAMAGSAQRHFAYAIGEGNPESVNLWFNASLLLRIGFSFAITAIALPLGWYMLDNVLVIPKERLAACKIAFLFSLITLFIQVLAVPFIGIFTAKQRIVELSVYQTAQTVLMLFFAYALTFVQKDRLTTYGAGVAAIALLISGTQITRCFFGFRECRLRILKRTELGHVLNLVSFAGWNLFGALGAVARRQGMAFLINIFCGPRFNASFGLSNQVSAQMSGISQGFFNALAPEITASEGRGNRERVVSLALRACKFSVILVCFLLIPMMIELDTILEFWLKEIPPQTAMFCRIVLVSFLIDKMTIGYMAAVAARGLIAGYQATLGTALLCAPVIAWVLLANDWNIVPAVGTALIITQTVCSLGRVWWVRRLMQIPISRWFWAVPVRCFLATAIPASLAAFIALSLSPSIGRLILSFLVCGISLCATGWLFGLDNSERIYLSNILRKGLPVLRKPHA